MVNINRTQISIIIPTLNEAKGLGRLLRHLQQIKDPELNTEIIVVDGGSQDNTTAIAAKHGAIVVVTAQGRAKQMNHGAQSATANILYFLHADTYPPKGFDQQIIAQTEKGFVAGCFRLQFDSPNPVLAFFAYLSRINHPICRGGDQSLFICKNTFKAHKGFNEAYIIYEDTEFISRLYKTVGFTVIPLQVITSARKYQAKGWLRLQYHFGMIHLKNYLGAGPKELYQYYKEHILH